MVEILQHMDVLERIRDELFLRFARVVAGPLCTYDILLNLDVEIKYVWAALNPRNRSIKIGPVVFNLVYLAQRYLPLWDRFILATYDSLGPSDTKTCVVTYKMSAWNTVIGLVLSECILATRIWAIWADKPSVRVVLVGLALICSISAVLFFVRFVTGVQCQFLSSKHFLRAVTHIPRCIRPQARYAQHGTASRVLLFNGEQGALPALEYVDGF
ncbi:hypothetical protein E1B28_010670 [Marasmius oreades]|uniref:DUF6533 domain-containing protein n=1 Tax=Marasmius oreades TaxID=181124 RepID=A0A9P7RXQ8_9AGAR|nr:uncharacterized protein E1B28_010670 [Marasmius oreades]KAG7091649.1 hypothetical protein E1B28_010670 [Marasmius oreades]